MVGVTLLPVIPAHIQGPMPSTSLAVRKMQQGLIKLAVFSAATITGLLTLQHVSGAGTTGYQHSTDAVGPPKQSVPITIPIKWAITGFIYYCSGECPAARL